MVTRQKIIEWCKKELGCDTARFVKPGEMFFLIIGNNRSTKDDAGQWSKNGELFDFDYVAEKVIASGTTLTEVMRSAEYYKHLLLISMKEYLKEELGLGV